MALAMLPPDSSLFAAEAFYHFLCVSTRFSREEISDSLDRISRLYFKDSGFILEIINSSVSFILK